MKKFYYLIFIIILINLSSTLFAQESNSLPGYKYLGKYDSNPHEVEIYITPSDPKIGIIRLAAKIKHLDDKIHIKNAKVSIYLTSKDSGTKLYNLALNSPNDYVHYLSQYMSLNPGDVIATGTPPGVGLGMKPPVFLKSGDVMKLSIEGLGEQSQKCIQA